VDLRVAMIQLRHCADRAPLMCFLKFRAALRGEFWESLQGSFNESLTSRVGLT